MILRIYKTHDHDLMALHQTGTLDIAKAAKAAVIAYYKGERFRFDLKFGQYPDSKAMPSVAAFQIEFDEELDRALGILDWLDTFEDGYRNCCIKGILRFYLADPCISMFRRDGWQPGFFKEPEKQVSMAGKPMKRKRGPAGESMGKEKNSYTAPPKIQEQTDTGGEEDFDAFEALFELRKGN